MEVLIEKKMIDEPVMQLVDHHGKPSPPTELEPSEEFPILYGLLTAPKSFKPKNSEELQFLPHELSGCNGVVMGRVQLMQSRPVADSDIISMEEADSQNLDFCREDSGASSRSSSCSPQMVDSSSNLSTADENDSPIFLNYLSERRNRNSRSGNRGDSMSDDESSMVSSPGGSSAGGDECLDDNIPTSTTSGFKRKASRLETAIGNIVRRRRVQKRVSPNSNNNNNNSSMLSVPISMAPSSPTVSTTCVDPPAPSSALSQQNSSRGRSEILERILRSSTTNTVNNPPASQQQLQPSGRDNVPRNEDRRNNDTNNNNNDGGYEPYAKLRDLLTMSEDQLVKRRRIEYGLPNSNNNKNGGGEHGDTGGRGREFSPPRNNILASLLQKGRQFDPPRGGRYPLENNAVIRNSPGIVSININLSDSNDSSSSNGNDERPYKCSLCDLRFKKLPLLNRHVKTHSHIKRYVCRFCSHAFKRSDNLLAHMRTSCKGIKDADAKFAGGVRQSSGTQGQMIPSLLSPSPSSLNGQGLASSSHSVSRSQLEEALLSLQGQNDKTCNNQNSNSLVSTTTASPPPPAVVVRRQIIQPGPDFQSRHSKLLEILSGSPVIPNSNLEDEMPLPLSLKVERCSSSPSSLSPSSSQSQLLRSHQRTLYYNNLVKQNELPDEDSQTEEEEDEVHESEQPLDLGSSRVLPPPVQQPTPAVPSVRSRDHPEIVSILSRQPKNVEMMAPDLRKFVGIDSL